MKIDCINVRTLCAPLPPFDCGLGGLGLRLNFQKGGGGLTGSQFLEVSCWEKGGNFFRGLQFLHKKLTKI